MKSENGPCKFTLMRLMRWRWNRKRFSRRKWCHRCQKELLSLCFLSKPSAFHSFLAFNANRKHSIVACFILIPCLRKLLNSIATMKIKSNRTNRCRRMMVTVLLCSNSSAIEFFVVVFDMSKSFCTRSIFYLHMNCEQRTQSNVFELARSKS